MKGVDASGGASDGPITYEVKTFEDALKLAKESPLTDIAYTWHAPTERFIEKPPSKGAGIWCEDDNCDFFMWANSKVKPLTPEELQEIENQRIEDEH